MINIFKNKLTINVLLIVIIFIISVLIRLDNLRAPLGRHHEFITGHVLSTVSILESNGASAHYFAPVATFNSSADLAVAAKDSLKDKRGYGYYTSYPPFCFTLPYFIFKATGTHASIAGIRLISLINHFLCALLILLIVNRMYGKKLKETIYYPSYIAYLLYLFAAGNLWFHANLWFADMLVHLFILSSLFVFMSIYEKPAEKLKRKVVLLFVFTFLGVYTEYLALFVAFFIGVYLLLKLIKNRKYIIYLITIIVASVSSLGLVVYQYSSIAGFKNYKQAAISKYKVRSGYDKAYFKSGQPTIYDRHNLDGIWYNYTMNYNALVLYSEISLVILILLFLMNLYRKKKWRISAHWYVIGLLFLAILTHHLVFFNFTVIHDFSVLKVSMLLSLFVASVIGLVYENIDFAHGKKIILATALAGTFVFVHFSMRAYYRVNNSNGDYLIQKVVGETIAKYAEQDELVFINEYPTPVMCWYAKRNVISIGPYDVKWARWYLGYYQNRKAILIQGKQKDRDYVMYVTRFAYGTDSIAVAKVETKLE